MVEDIRELILDDSTFVVNESDDCFALITEANPFTVSTNVGQVCVIALHDNLTKSYMADSRDEAFQVASYTAHGVKE